MNTISINLWLRKFYANVNVVYYYASMSRNGCFQTFISSIMGSLFLLKEIFPPKKCSNFSEYLKGYFSCWWCDHNSSSAILQKVILKSCSSIFGVNKGSNPNLNGTPETAENTTIYDDMKAQCFGYASSPTSLILAWGLCHNKTVNFNRKGPLILPILVLKTQNYLIDDS